MFKKMGVAVRQVIFDTLDTGNGHAVRSVAATGFVVKNFISGIINTVDDAIRYVVDLVIEIITQTINAFFQATRVALGTLIGFPQLPEVDKDA